MSIISTITQLKNKVKQLKESQAQSYGARKTPIYVPLDAFALFLGWNWNGTTRPPWSINDMNEFFTHYVPVLNELEVTIYSYLPVSTFDLGVRNQSASPDLNYLTFVADKAPPETTHNFGGTEPFTYNFRQVAQINAELPWLDAMQMDVCEALIPRQGIPTNHPYYIAGIPNGHSSFQPFVENGNTWYTGLDYYKNIFRFTSTGGNTWSRFMHEIARQKVAGYHTIANGFTQSFINAMSGYSWSSTDVNYQTVVNGKNAATLQDLRQTITLFWRDCVRYLKGTSVVGSNGTTVTLAVPYQKVMHYANGVGPLTNYQFQPLNSLRGTKPFGIIEGQLFYTSEERSRRNPSNNAVYYNKSYFRSETLATSSTDGVLAGSIWYKNNDIGFSNLSYMADQYGNPEVTTRLYPTYPNNYLPAFPTVEWPNSGINIYGNPNAPRTNTIKNYIAIQSNADSYGTNLYYFQGCGQEWKDLIEAGIRVTDTNIGKYKTVNPNVVLGSPAVSGSNQGSDEEQIANNDISSCSGLVVAGTKETYDDLLYWIASTSAAHVGHLRSQIIRNLSYNKSYITGIVDSNPTGQQQEIEKLAKKPICVILSGTPAEQAGRNGLVRTHLFKCWPKNVEEYVTPIISGFFQNGDKNTTIVDKPDEIMFWNASWYYDIQYPRQHFGSLSPITTSNLDQSTKTPENIETGIKRWEVVGSRIGWEKLVFGRPKLTNSELCAINYKTSSVPLENASSYLESIKWCEQNMLPDDLWSSRNPTAVWWSTTGTNSIILNKGLKPLNDTDHELYPYFKGTALGTSVDLYAAGQIKHTDVMQALARYQSNWMLRMLQETRKQLDRIGA